jgi:hypothetical protein
MKYLKSRTVWTLVIAFVLAGFQSLEGSIPEEVFSFVMMILTAIATYFRVNPRV